MSDLDSGLCSMEHTADPVRIDYETLVQKLTEAQWHP